MVSQRQFNENNIQHLNGENWSHANAHLVGKILRELTHEKLIAPVCLVTPEDGYHHYSFTPDQDRIEYLFKAKCYQLDHLDIDPSTLTKNP